MYPLVALLVLLNEFLPLLRSCRHTLKVFSIIYFEVVFGENLGVPRLLCRQHRRQSTATQTSPHLFGGGGGTLYKNAYAVVSVFVLGLRVEGEPEADRLFLSDIDI